MLTQLAVQTANITWTSTDLGKEKQHVHWPRTHSSIPPSTALPVYDSFSFTHSYSPSPSHSLPPSYSFTHSPVEQLAPVHVLEHHVVVGRLLEEILLGRREVKNRATKQEVRNRTWLRTDIRGGEISGLRGRARERQEPQWHQACWISQPAAQYWHPQRDSSQHDRPPAGHYCTLMLSVTSVCHNPTGSCPCVTVTPPHWVMYLAVDNMPVR